MAAAASLYSYQDVHAATDSWKTTVGSGNWSDPTNWTLGLPVSGADASIVHADGVKREVDYDYTGTNIVNILRVNNTGGGVDTLNLSANNLSANVGSIGFSHGVGALNISGGTNTFGTLNVGSTTGTGRVTFSGGLLQAINGPEYIGQDVQSTGFMTQSGGTHTVTYDLYVGNNFGSGTYNLSDGTLSVGLSAYHIGYQRGTGVFNQSGGSVVGPYYLSIGDHGGVGVYNLDGGSITLGEALNIADWQGNVAVASGTLNMTNGSITALSAWIGKGDNTRGVIVQSGGTITLTGPGGMNISGSPYAFNINASGTYQLLGGVLASSGTGRLTVYPNSLLQVSTNATIVGFGPFNHTGGTVSFAGTLTIDSFGTAAVQSYNQTGGTFSAKGVVNNGTFGSTNGAASVGAMTGTGFLRVGGGTGTALVSADYLVQSNVTVDSGGTLNVGPVGGLVQPMAISGTMTITNAATVTLMPTANSAASSGVRTNYVKTLNIGSDGSLDLQNHFISVDNTATPFANVHQYIDAAYNRNATTGFGDYSGRGGITSSVVKAHADTMSVGYYDGALQDPSNPNNIGQVLGPNANSGAGTGIPRTQILVRPTLTGDLNGDGVVNSYDVNLFNTFGLFGSPTNLGYQAGDLNGDGVVDAKDVTIFNSAGNFNNGSYSVVTAALKGAKAASTLTGRSASPAAELNPASGTMAFSYDPATGDVKVNYNGFTGFAGKQTFNTTNRALSLIDILSTGGAFALDSTKLTPEAKLALSSTTFTGNTEINLTAVNGYLPDGTDLGRILAPGLDPAQLAGALTLTFNYTGSRQLSGGVAGLIVPEPATFSLIGFGALGLLARRRNRE